MYIAFGVLCSGISQLIATMPRAPIGLPNINSTCYMNAGLQSLYQVIPLTSGLLALPEDGYSEGSLARAYQQFVRDYTSSTDSVAKPPILEAFYEPLQKFLSDVGREAMQDVTEAIRPILVSLQGTSEDKRPLGSQFGFTAEYHTTCQTCHISSDSTQEIHNSLDIQTSQADSLRGCLDVYFTSEQVYRFCYNVACPHSGYKKIVTTLLSEVKKKDETLYQQLFERKDALFKQLVAHDGMIKGAIEHIDLSSDSLAKLNLLLDPKQSYSFVGEVKAMSLIVFLNKNKSTAMDRNVVLLSLPQTFYIALAQQITQTLITLNHSIVTIFNNKPHSFFLQKPQKNDLYMMYNPQMSGNLANTLELMHIKTSIIYALHEALYAEQAARFISMDTSTRNAEKLLIQTKIDYNKARQASITSELIELSASTQLID